MEIGEGGGGRPKAKISKKQKTTTKKTVKNARMLKGSKGKKDSEKVISGI